MIDMHIILPTDYSFGAGKTAHYAARKWPQHTLHVVHVTPDPVEASDRAALHHWVEQVGIEAVEEVISAPHPHTAIVAYAEEHLPSTIVMHEGKYGFLGMGSTSKLVVDQATVPTIVLRDDDWEHPIEGPPLRKR